MKTALTFRSSNGDQQGEWTFQHSLWLLGEMNRPLSEGGLGPDPEPPSSVAYDITGYGFTPGSAKTPWTMRTVNEWMGASKQAIEAGIGLNAAAFYEVGGILLERNPSTGGYANYITAVVDTIANPLVPVYEESPRGMPLMFHGQVDRTDRTIYEIKCERLNATGRDREVAAMARAVMKRERKTVPRDLLELPNTLGAMFISEVARLPMMLPLGLMLLDLIEAGVHYGTTTPKQYTWDKMMKYIDPALSAEERLDQSKLIGGKHPMMHENSIKQAKSFFFYTETGRAETGYAVNPVSRRSVSILVAWLHMYFRSSACHWKVGQDWGTLVHSDRVARPDTPLDLKRDFVKKLPGITPGFSSKASPAVAAFYTQAVLPAIRRRSGTLDCLLS